MTSSAAQSEKRGSSAAEIVPAVNVESRVLLLRGEKVLLDADLARLYGVATKVLNQAVRRNLERFPADFMFQLTVVENEALMRSQFVTSKMSATGGRRYLPYAFTEQGIAMLSSVLRSSRAIAVNIEVMRAFVRLRQMISSSTELARKLGALEKKYDAQFKIVFDAIRELMTPPTPKQKNEMGFHTGIPALRRSAAKKTKPAAIPA